MVTKQARVFRYLLKGHTLTEKTASNIFGVANLRATMSDIKPHAHSLGFTVERTVGRSGETRYGILTNR